MQVNYLFETLNTFCVNRVPRSDCGGRPVIIGNHVIIGKAIKLLSLSNTSLLLTVVTVYLKIPN